MRFSHVGEDRVDGNLAYMGIDPANWNTSGWIDDLEYVGLNGRDQFDIGSLNDYADFDDRPGRGARRRRQPELHAAGHVHLRDRRRRAHAQDRLHLQPVMVRPQRIGANDNGTFEFRHNLPFNPANPLTYPSRFSIVLGDIEIDAEDNWTNGFVQDQWRVNNNLTLNLGLRYDYQDADAEHEGRARAAHRLRLRPSAARAARSSAAASASSTSTT